MFPTRYAIFYTTIASLTFFIVGYDDAMIRTSQSCVRNDLKLSFKEYDVFMTLTTIYEILGSILAAILADKQGRRFTIMVSGLILLLGTTWTYFSTSLTMLMIGRFIIGFSFGFYLTVSPIYIVELSPPSVRGFLGSFLEVLYNMGFGLDFAMNLASSSIVDDLRWRISFSSIAIPSFLITIAMGCMIESPYWLIMHGRLHDATEAVHRCSATSEEADEMLTRMRASFGIPTGAMGNNVDIPVHIRGNNIVVWRELFHPTPDVRKILISIVGVHVFQQAAAIVTLIFLSSSIMIYGGLNSMMLIRYALTGIVCLKTLCSLFPVFAMDKIGRRPLALVSIGIMTVSLGILGSSLLTMDGSYHFSGVRTVVHIACLVMFVVGYSIGLGPIAWFYSAELLSTRLRSSGVSLAGVVVNRVTCGFLMMVSSALYRLTTYGSCFLMHAAFLVPGVIFSYKYIIETRTRNLDEEIS